jgi:hypothetical protein
MEQMIYAGIRKKPETNIGIFLAEKKRWSGLLN